MDADDADLVERTLAGERHAFEALVARHLVRARALAGVVLDRDPAQDDAVQEAFLRAYRNLGDLGDPARFAPWLMAIVRREALRLRRRAPAMEASAQLPAPDAQADEDERLPILRRHLRQLPEAERTVLALRYEAELSTEAIAATLGITVAAAEKRLQRARALVEERLARDAGWPR